MEDKKEKIIKGAIDNYKKLSKDKQMFVLGYIQGVLCNRSENKQSQEA